MTYNLVTYLQVCDNLIKTTAPTGLLLYSHIPTALIALLIGFFVYFKNRSDLAGRILFGIGFIFSLWSLFDLITWFSRDSRLTMFSWAVLGILDILIFILSLYLTYVFIDKHDISLAKKLILGVLFLPVIIFTPTVLNLPGFDVQNCEAMEGHYFTTYYHFLGLGIFLWLLIMVAVKYKKAEGEFRKQILLFFSGIGFFLFSFFVSGYLSSYLDNFKLSIYGMFGMVIFMAMLAYLIVKFEAFEIKLIAAQALVVSLVLLIGSQFFFIQNNTNKILTGITLALSVGFGYMLIRSVRQEVERKEQLQTMADKLAGANDQLRKLDNAKTEFLSIASHQLRTPLTAIKGFVSLLLEGTYGEIKVEQRGALEKVYSSAERLIQLVEDLLNVSRIESGRLQFVIEKADMGKVLNELYENFLLVAKTKQFYLDLKVPKEGLPEIKFDYSKVRELISNFVDNALKYTEKGGVTITAEKRATGVVVDESGFVIPDKQSAFGEVIRVTVSDTGIGVPKEEIPYLFKKFSRGKDVSRLHVGGTGLGLYVGKAIAEAHHGAVWVESDGAGMGSRFIIELPINN